VRIWIDADATPREVKEVVFRAAKRLGIETILVANQRLQPPPGNPLVGVVWVDGGGPPPYDARAKQAFAEALDRILTRLRTRPSP